MSMYPEVQKKARALLDEVVSANHPPTFEDLDEIPYIYALLKETMRWRTIMPLCEINFRTVRLTSG